LQFDSKLEKDSKNNIDPAHKQDGDVLHMAQADKSGCVQLHNICEKDNAMEKFWRVTKTRVMLITHA
jgi:hypothetical protein